MEHRVGHGQGGHERGHDHGHGHEHDRGPGRGHHDHQHEHFDHQAHHPHGHSHAGPPQGEARGPRDSEFLDLELSRVLHEEARTLAREAVRDLVKAAITERLRERLGDRLRGLAMIAADELADDIEANLDIEAAIARRREAREDLDARVREALGRR